MLKKLFLFAFALGMSAMSNAQISTGETSSKVIRTGNRAQAGNFGIYLGATSDIFKNIGASGVNFSAIPLINVKYMKTDQLEYRLGFEWYDKYESDNQFDGDNDDVKYSSTNSESKFMFYPGVAYHFSPKNLLDVYVGAEVPIGFGTVGNHSYVDGNDGEGNDISAREGHTAKVFRMGAGAFIGLQAYIANLPIALGVEYGVSTLYNHYYQGTFERDGYYLSNIDASSIDAQRSATKWKLGNQFRVTLAYYFSLK